MLEAKDRVIAKLNEQLNERGPDGCVTQQDTNRELDSRTQKFTSLKM